MNVRRALPVLLPILITIATGLPGITGGLIRDDTLYVTQNPHVTEPTSIGTMFRTPFQPDHELGLFRPLTTVTLRLDFVLSDALGLPVTRHSAPMGHVTNLLLASIATVLVFLLGRGLGFGPVAAGMASALFAAHPARTEAVIWISGRAECLMTVFALGCLVAAVRGTSWWRGPLTASLCLLSFLSKEQAVVLAVLVPLLPRLERRVRVVLGAWVTATLVAAFVWRSSVLGGMGPTGGQQVLAGWTFMERVPLGLAFLGDYVRLVLWPYPLLNEYDEPTSVPVFGAILGLAIVALFVWRCLRDQRDTFLLGLFAGPLAIVLNVFYRTGETFAERFLALPLAGAILYLVRLVAMRPRLGGSVLFTATCVCAALAARRAGDYENDTRLAEAMIRDAPESAASWRLIAGVHRRDRALALEVVALAAQDHEGQQNLRRITSIRKEERPLIDEMLAPDYAAERLEKIAEERRHEKAMFDAMRKGIELNPDDHYLRLDIARELKAEGVPKTTGGAIDLFALEEAERHLRYVLDRHPENYEAHNLLAEVLLTRASKLAGAPQEKLIKEAEAALRETLRIEPRKDTAGQDLARILLRQKRVPELMQFLERQRDVFARLAERRWWDPRGLQLQASVIRSIAQIQGNGSAGTVAGLPLLRQALERSNSPPWRVRLIRTNLLPALRELSRSNEYAGQRPWLKEAADLIESEVAYLTERLDGPPCITSDLCGAIAALEMERNDTEAAARWFERAGEASQLPDARKNLLRTAAHMWLRKGIESPPGPRLTMFENAARLRRRIFELQ